MSTAVLGSVIGRSSNVDTVHAIDALIARRRGRRVDALHRCPDGYQHYVCLADTCERCGWSPLVPVPDIEATARGLVAMYGPDAVWFVMALADVIEEELHGYRR